MSTGALLALATLYYLWWPPVPAFVGSADKEGVAATRVRRAAARANLSVVALLAGLYWVAQVTAHLYPDAAVSDSADPAHAQMQACVEVSMLALTSAGWALEARAVEA
jgi:hypothetical protein